MSHTPGPWKIETYGELLQICGPSGEAIAEIGSVAEPASAQEWSNARLIAAATEMLEILRQVERVYGDRYPDVIAVIRKAAEGQS